MPTEYAVIDARQPEVLLEAGHSIKGVSYSATTFASRELAEQVHRQYQEEQRLKKYSAETQQQDLAKAMATGDPVKLAACYTYDMPRWFGGKDERRLPLKDANYTVVSREVSAWTTERAAQGVSA